MQKQDFTNQPPTGVSISLRPITDDDLEFLFRLYASTREQERTMAGWPDEQWDEFMRMQFRLQHTQYMCGYGNPAFNIVLVDGIPAGRFYVDRGPEEYRLIDISLLPEFRSRGFGGSLIGTLLLEAEGHCLPVSLYVQRFSPAARLYQRLGFRMAEYRGAFWFMTHPSCDG